MKVCVIGSGGREHALVWALARSEKLTKLYAVPGNVGMEELAERKVIAVKPPFAEVANWLEDARVDLVVVGPEAPLVERLADVLEARGIKVFGPTAAGAQIEGSKSFAKEIMAEAGVATARHQVCGDFRSACEALWNFEAPYVIKADGLAAGKGVSIHRLLAEAEERLVALFDEKILGAAAERVVIEEHLEGDEISVLALCDGRNFVLLEAAQDHKRLRDKDEGPNTGGMGTICPTPAATPELMKEIGEKFFRPVLDALRHRGIYYRGVLYAGLVLTKQGPKALEFNCRFGDPETQAMLPRLESDLLELLMACAEGNLDPATELKWRRECCVCVVAASLGYPDAPEIGKTIRGLEKLRGENDLFVFHAGIARDGEKLITSGGRVLGVSALGENVETARARAVSALKQISFQGMHYRKDIGWRALGEKE